MLINIGFARQNSDIIDLSHCKNHDVNLGFNCIKLCSINATIKCHDYSLFGDVFANGCNQNKKSH
jgi:hypothetical protein